MTWYGVMWCVVVWCVGVRATQLGCAGLGRFGAKVEAKTVPWSVYVVSHCYGRKRNAQSTHATQAVESQQPNATRMHTRRKSVRVRSGLGGGSTQNLPLRRPSPTTFARRCIASSRRSNEASKPQVTAARSLHFTVERKHSEKETTWRFM